MLQVPLLISARQTRKQQRRSRLRGQVKRGVIKARNAPQKIESTQSRQAVAAGRAMGVVFMAGLLGLDWVESNRDGECVT
jgi:hypothetical protein